MNRSSGRWLGVALVAGIAAAVFAYTRFDDVVFVLARILSSGPPGWERMEPPDVPGEQGMAAIESFVATNGWNMSMTPFDFAFGLTKPPELKGLPWRRLRSRGYPALTHEGILYVALEGFHHDVIGVAYNPKTNAFDRSVIGFKPVGDHWYVWTTTDEPLKLTKKYEVAR